VSTIGGILTEDCRATRIDVRTETEVMVYMCGTSVIKVIDIIYGIQNENNRESAAAVSIEVASGASERIWIAS
jgi:hypothetical protein